MKGKAYDLHGRIEEVMASFIEDGYNVRKFDPAGQDDIGGGCGQLWYVQDFLKQK
jgi:23S rRNA (adenine2503-C2)-methyltransferase